MKKLVIILATLLVAGCSSGVEEKLVGRWSGISDGEDVVMIFKENNKISIQVGSDIGQGTYHVYGSTNPYDLDIDFDESRSRQSRRGKISTIIALNDRVLTLEDNEPGKPRPLEFSSEAVHFFKE